MEGSNPFYVNTRLQDWNLDGEATDIQSIAYAVDTFDPNKPSLQQTTFKQIGEPIEALARPFATVPHFDHIRAGATAKSA